MRISLVKLVTFFLFFLFATGLIIPVCNPLCFLSCRYGGDGVKQLKSALLDFYDVADLVTAKSVTRSCKADR